MARSGADLVSRTALTAAAPTRRGGMPSSSGSALTRGTLSWRNSSRWPKENGEKRSTSQAWLPMRATHAGTRTTRAAAKAVRNPPPARRARGGARDRTSPRRPRAGCPRSSPPHRRPPARRSDDPAAISRSQRMARSGAPAAVAPPSREPTTTRCPHAVSAAATGRPRKPRPPSTSTRTASSVGRHRRPAFRDFGYFINIRNCHLDKGMHE